MLTADALLLEPDYTEVELIYSRDKYRVAWAALWMWQWVLIMKPSMFNLSIDAWAPAEIFPEGGKITDTLKI